MKSVMKQGTEEIKWLQTASESAAVRKVLETRESLTASTGVVRESMAAMHSSGNSSNAPILMQYGSVGLAIFIYINVSYDTNR